jgi:hypothetical protein
MPAIPKAFRSFLTWEIIALVLVGGELLFEGLNLSPRRPPHAAVRHAEMDHQKLPHRDTAVLKKAVTERGLTSSLNLEKIAPMRRTVVLSAARPGKTAPAKSPRQVVIAKPKQPEREQRPAGKLAASTNSKVPLQKQHGVEGPRFEVHTTTVQPVPPSQELARHGSTSSVASVRTSSRVPAAHPTQTTIFAGKEMPKKVPPQKEGAPIRLATYAYSASARDSALKRGPASPEKQPASVSRKSNPAPVLPGTVWKADYGEAAIFLWFQDRGKGRWCEEPICWRMDKNGIVQVTFEDGQPFFLLKFAQNGKTATEKQQTGRLRSWTRLANIASVPQQPQPAASAAATPPVRSCACAAYQPCESFDRLAPVSAALSRSTPSLPSQR